MPGESVCMFSCSSTLADRAGRAPQANGVKPPAASAGSSTSLTGGTESSLDKMLTKGASVVEEGMDGRGRGRRLSGQRFRNALHGEITSRMEKGIREEKVHVVL